jgi:type II secretory pathway component PulJ
MTRRQHDEGFSLLETLLGLTLTAIIGLLMMNSMQMGTRVWEREKTASRAGTSQLVLTQTGEWLAHALSAKVRNYDEPMTAPFKGEEHALTFLYAAASLGGSPGLYTIHLDLVEAEGCKGGRDLYLEMTRDVLSDNREAPIDVVSERRRLMQCIETPSFIYWGDHALQGQRAWFSTWTNEPQLPSVVRLRSIDAKGVERALLTQQLQSALP